MSKNPLIVSDEPATEDLLERDVYARTLRKMVQNCQTPLVIGVHGDWGSGKTSFMRLTQDLLEKEGVRTVWFNPWIYQFDESPIIPLLYEIRKQAIIHKVKIEGLKLLSVLTSLAGEVILRLATGGIVSSEFILRQGKDFEAKYFEVKTITMNLHNHFQEIVNVIAGKNGRLVIFVDDLDRCCPQQSLKVLEAIKLFLNAKNCVYVVGMDREVIEQAVANQYGNLKLSGVSYLDKIIQLPFNLPPVTEEEVDKYLDQLMQGDEMKPYYGIIRIGTGRNPRAVKRFVNTFLFNNMLAHEKKIKNKPHILIKLLLLQLRYPDFYRYISRHKGEFAQIEEWALLPTLTEEHRKNIQATLMKFLIDPDFIEILREKPLINKEDITPYIHLTNIVSPPIAKEIKPDPIVQEKEENVCPNCGSTGKVVGTRDTWGGDSDGNYPRYAHDYRCPNCGCDF